MKPNFHRNTTTDKGDTSVTHHAKAPSAGSSMRGGSRLGRIVRGAFAFRVSSPRVNGNGAPAGTRTAEVGSAHSRVLLVRAAAMLAIALTAFAAASLTTAVASPGECPNEASREEQHAAYLPDCRAYELVSPAEKHGLGVAGDGTRIRAAAETGALPAAVSFASYGGFAGVEGTGEAADYLAERTALPGTPGWSTHGLTPKQDPLSYLADLDEEEASYEGDFSPDLTKGVFRSYSPVTEEPLVAATPDLYFRDDLRTAGPGHYILLSTCPLCEETGIPLPGPNAFPKQFQPYLRLAAETSDLHHVLFETKSDLLPDAVGSGRFGTTKLYKSDEGRLHLVSDGTGTCPANPFSPAAPCAIAGLGVSAGHRSPHALSTDGSRVNFSAPVGPLASITPESDLYQLDDRGTATTADDATFKLDESEGPVPSETGEVKYQTASADGNRVFFSTGRELTSAPEGGLYMWERQSHNEVQSLSVDATGGAFNLTVRLGALEATTPPLAFDATAAQVQSALEALSGPPPIEQRLLGEGNVSVSGGPGGAAPYEIEFTGALAGVDVPALTADSSGLSGGGAIATPSVTVPVHNLTLLVPGQGAQVDVVAASEDGHRVYFWATYQRVPGAPALREYVGIFLWQDAEPGPSLWFVGQTQGSENQNLAIDEKPSARRFPEMRVTPDGETLLFASLGAESEQGFPSCECRAAYAYSLKGSTPQDPNLTCVSCEPGGSQESRETTTELTVIKKQASWSPEHLSRLISPDGRHVFFTTDTALVPRDTNGTFDAYEYDLKTHSAHLLSSGASHDPSYFMELSPDGRDAYILTDQSLVGWDKASYDLYDVRVDGGFPEPPAPQHAPCHGEESCRNAAPSPPASPEVGSTLEGPGNLPRRPHCANLRHRRHGKRCPRHRRHHTTKRSRGRAGGGRK